MAKKSMIKEKIEEICATLRNHHIEPRITGTKDKFPGEEEDMEEGKIVERYYIDLSGKIDSIYIYRTDKKEIWTSDPYFGDQIISKIDNKDFVDIAGYIEEYLNKNNWNDKPRSEEKKEDMVKIEIPRKRIEELILKQIEYGNIESGRGGYTEITKKEAERKYEEIQKIWILFGWCNEEDPADATNCPEWVTDFMAENI